MVMSASVVAQSSDCCPGMQQRPRIFRDAATHESLEAEARENPRVNPMEHLAQNALNLESPKKDAEPYKPTDLLERSYVINRGGVATLVPKQAVLHVPENLNGCMGMTREAEVVNWPEFYRNNRSWIQTIEVKRAQAEGREPLPEEMKERVAESSQMVIAVYHANPITVLPYVDPSAGPETANIEEQ